MRFGDAGLQYDDEPEHKEDERGDLHGQGVKNVRLGNFVADEVSEDERRRHAADRIERAAVLDEPVAALSAAAAGFP